MGEVLKDQSSVGNNRYNRRKNVENESDISFGDLPDLVDPNEAKGEGITDSIALHEDETDSGKPEINGFEFGTEWYTNDLEEIDIYEGIEDGLTGVDVGDYSGDTFETVSQKEVDAVDLKEVESNDTIDCSMDINIEMTNAIVVPLDEPIEPVETEEGETFDTSDNSTDPSCENQTTLPLDRPVEVEECEECEAIDTSDLCGSPEEITKNDPTVTSEVLPKIDLTKKIERPSEKVTQISTNKTPDTQDPIPPQPRRKKPQKNNFVQYRKKTKSKNKNRKKNRRNNNKKHQPPRHTQTRQRVPRRRKKELTWNDISFLLLRFFLQSIRKYWMIIVCFLMFAVVFYVLQTPSALHKSDNIGKGLFSKLPRRNEQREHVVLRRGKDGKPERYVQDLTDSVVTYEELTTEQEVQDFLNSLDPFEKELYKDYFKHGAPVVVQTTEYQSKSVRKELNKQLEYVEMSATVTMGGEEDAITRKLRESGIIEEFKKNRTEREKREREEAEEREIKKKFGLV